MLWSAHKSSKWLLGSNPLRPRSRRGQEEALCWFGAWFKSVKFCSRKTSNIMKQEEARNDTNFIDRDLGSVPRFCAANHLTSKTDSEGDTWADEIYKMKAKGINFLCSNALSQFIIATSETREKNLDLTSVQVKQKTKKKTKMEPVVAAYTISSRQNEYSARGKN